MQQSQQSVGQFFAAAQTPAAVGPMQGYMQQQLQASTQADQSFTQQHPGGVSFTPQYGQQQYGQPAQNFNTSQGFSQGYSQPQPVFTQAAHPQAFQSQFAPQQQFQQAQQSYVSAA